MAAAAAAAAEITRGEGSDRTGLKRAVEFPQQKCLRISVDHTGKVWRLLLPPLKRLPLKPGSTQTAHTHAKRHITTSKHCPTHAHHKMKKVKRTPPRHSRRISTCSPARLWRSHMDRHHLEGLDRCCAGGERGPARQWGAAQITSTEEVWLLTTLAVMGWQ